MKNNYFGFTRYNSGFINLDKYLNVTFDQINTNNDIRYIKKEHHIFEFEKDNLQLIYKPQMNIKECYNELLAYQLSTLLGLNCAYYDLATFDGTIGVLTPNFKKQNLKYINFSVLAKEYSKDDDNHLKYQVTLNNIENFLKPHYNSQIVDYLMEKIIKIFCFDILICNNDRTLSNLEIVEGHDFVDLVPLFDHTLCFDYSEKSVIEVNFKHEYALDFDISHYEVLKDFLEVFSDVYKNIFIEMNQKFTMELLENALKSIEIQTERKIPEEIRKSYEMWFLNHKTKLEEVLENFPARRR